MVYSRDRSCSGASLCYSCDPPTFRRLPILQFSVLGSGSKGNCVYIENSNHRILLDAGLSLRSLKERMALIGRDLADVSAVFLTHEHSDHIKGVGMLAKKHNLPLYGTRGTLAKIEHHLPASADWHSIEREDEVCLGNLKVESYPTPHDGVESVAFVVHYEDRRLGHATDLGCIDKTLLEKMSGCDALLVESNHDPKMLKAGPYPWSLKQRVGGDRGHLSNQECAQLLNQVKHDELQTVVLMHLSGVNNHPDIVRQHATPALAGSRAQLHISRQDHPTPLIPLI